MRPTALRCCPTPVAFVLLALGACDSAESGEGVAPSAAVTDAAEPSAAAPEPAPEPKDPQFEAAKRRAQIRAAIKADEVVQFFPVDIAEQGPGRWVMNVHGWIYEPEVESFLRRAFVGQLKTLLELDDAAVESEIFTRRLAPFLVDNERSKQVDFIVGTQVVRSKASKANGHFFARVALDRDDVARARAGELAVEAITVANDTRQFVGRAHLVNSTAVLVISDIDDTVKISEVHDKRLLMRRTFLEEFALVPGLAAKYKAWLGGDGHLHFVSSSPWQLQAQIDLALRDGGFPRASYSLKTIRLKDPSVLDLFADPEQTKPLAIEAELSRHANTTVVLVGDSGERDPEVYAAVARRYPDRIKHIFIRNVSGEGPDAARWSSAFEGVRPGTWQVFDEASELPQRLTDPRR